MMTSHATVTVDQEMALANAADRLAEEFAGVRDREAISRLLHETHHQLSAHATVTGHLPTLAEHHTRQLLLQLRDGLRLPDAD